MLKIHRSDGLGAIRLYMQWVPSKPSGGRIRWDGWSGTCVPRCRQHVDASEVTDGVHWPSTSTSLTSVGVEGWAATDASERCFDAAAACCCWSDVEDDDEVALVRLFRSDSSICSWHWRKQSCTSRPKDNDVERRIYLPKCQVHGAGEGLRPSCSLAVTTRVTKVVDNNNYNNNTTTISTSELTPAKLGVKWRI